MGNLDEQRTYQRYDSTITAEMLVVDPRQQEKTTFTAPVQIINFSLGGMRLQSGSLPAEVARKLELGQYSVIIRFAAGRRQLEVRGQVRWIEAGAEGSQLGLRHVDVDPRTAQLLFDLIERRAAPRSYRRLWQVAPWVLAAGLLICWRCDVRRQGGPLPQQRSATLQAELERLRARRDRDEELLGSETKRLRDRLGSCDEKRVELKKEADSCAAEVVAAAARAKRVAVRTVTLSNVPFALRVLDSRGSHTAPAQPIRLSYEGGTLSGTLLRTNTAVGSRSTVDLELQAVDPRNRSKKVEETRRCKLPNLRFDRANRATFECQIELWPAGYVLMSLR